MPNHRQTAFARAFARTGSYKEAGTYAGYAESTAVNQGAVMLRKPELQAIVQAEMALKLAAFEPTVRDVIAELAFVAFGDATGIFDDAGELLPVSQWPLSCRRAIGSIEVVMKNAAAGDDQIDRVLKVRFYDKTKALELLARYLGMLVERKEVGGPGSFAALSDAELASRIHQASAKLVTITSTSVQETPTDTRPTIGPDLDAIIGPD